MTESNTATSNPTRRARDSIGRACRRHRPLRRRALLHQLSELRSGRSASSVSPCRSHSSSADCGTSPARGRGRGAFRPRKNTEQHALQPRNTRNNTEAWGSAPVSFARLARVRLAAEAFSYLTLRGIAGRTAESRAARRPRRCTRSDGRGRARTHCVRDRHDVDRWCRDPSLRSSDCR